MLTKRIIFSQTSKGNFTISYTVFPQKFINPVTHKVSTTMFILGNIFSRQKWSKSRTSFFIDSPLWYVKGDLYQDHDAKAAFVNFSSSNMIFRSAATSWRAGCPRAGPSHNRAAINTVFGVSQSFVKVYYYNI